MGADYASQDNGSGVDGMLVGLRDLVGQSQGLKVAE
jgi:hypothetical protein